VKNRGGEPGELEDHGIKRVRIATNQITLLFSSSEFSPKGKNLKGREEIVTAGVERGTHV